MADQEVLITKTGAIDAGASDGLQAATKPVKPKLGRPSQRNPGETKAKILASALKCFTEKGFAATTFAAVARGAALTGPAIYQYFDSKDALYAATLEHIYEDLLPDINNALIDKQGFKDRLREILLIAVKLHESNPAATAFLSAHPAEIRYEPSLKQHLSSSSGNVLAVLTQIFEDAQSAGEISPARSTESLTMFFFGCVMGLCLYHHSRQTIPIRDSIEVFFDVIENKLLLEPTSTTHV